MMVDPRKCVWCRHLVTKRAGGCFEGRCTLPFHCKCSNRIEYGTTSTNRYVRDRRIG